MNWRSLSSQGDLDQLIRDSYSHPQAIFKHSTRCPISAMAKSRLQSNWEEDLSDFPIYLLDLLSFRDLSNKIAEDLAVQHQSPQLIIVENGKSTYHASHSAISVSEVIKHNEK